jgi:hypothetical protein
MVVGFGRSVYHFVALNPTYICYMTVLAATRRTCSSGALNMLQIESPTLDGDADKKFGKMTIFIIVGFV